MIEHGAAALHAMYVAPLDAGLSSSIVKSARVRDGNEIKFAGKEGDDSLRSRLSKFLTSDERILQCD